jgi:endonuclease/exonuclease/phosphatase family metal-dependent hydrolase
MKNIFSFFLILLYPFIIHGQVDQANDQGASGLKIMSYNILNGFEWGKDSLREGEMITWVRIQKPDVMALQELCGFTQEKLEKIARKWGHNHALILKTDGYPVGLTSNKPIQLKEKLLEDLWHGMLHCETWGIDFYVVHLSPADWQFRRKEAKIITEKIQAGRNKNHIVLGDFNAHSPFDGDFDLKYPYQLERVRKSDETNEKYQNLREGQFDYSVISTFLALPLMDICQTYVPLDYRTTFPTPINVGKWLTEKEMPKTKCRLDYILVSPSLSLLSMGACIFNGKETQRLSDHYPVMAEFNISN